MITRLDRYCLCDWTVEAYHAQMVCDQLSNCTEISFSSGLIVTHRGTRNTFMCFFSDSVVSLSASPLVLRDDAGCAHNFLFITFGTIDKK